MKSEDDARTLSLRFEGDAVRNHMISVGLFTRTVSAVQKLLVHLAEARIGREPRLAGRKSGNIVGECELFLLPVRAGSVSVKMRLPQPEETLFPDYPDFSEQVLAAARDSLVYYSRGELDRIKELCPNPVHRRWVLKDLGSIAPRPRSDYSVTLRTVDGREHVLEPPPREELRRAFAEAEEEAPGPVDETMIVEAKGLAVVRGGADIIEWKETYDMVQLDLESIWRPTQIDWDDCHLRLRHAIAVIVEEREPSFWVAEHDQLGVLAYGETEEEAKEAFCQEFVVLWHEVALEDDAKLDAGAQALKRVLLGLVDQAVMV